MHNDIDELIMLEESKSKHLLKKVAKIVGIILLVLLIVLIIFGVIPASTKGIPSSPDPVVSYDQAIKRFEGIQEEEGPIVKDVAASRLMTHGEKTDKVYVLIHGLTNSPRQFIELGELLYEAGNNVLIVRIPHHGVEDADVGELGKLELEELTEYGDSVVDIAVGLGDEVHVVGLSVGGTVAAWIAQNRADVERVMLMSPMLGLGGMPQFVDYFLRNLFIRIPDISLGGPGEVVREHAYRGQSTRGVAVSMLLGQTVFSQARMSAPEVNGIIIVTNANDHTVDNIYAEKLTEVWENWGDEIVRYEFPKSLGFPHNLIDITEPGTDIDLVNQKILELLGENE